MLKAIFRKSLIMIILVGFIPLLNAEDRRTIPLDMYLIIDGSASLENSKNETISWINDQVVDRILMDGDSVTIWTAGDRARIIHEATLSSSSGKKELKDKLLAMDVKSKTADFSGALTEALPKVSKTKADRLAYTMLVTASAEGLEPALAGSSQRLFRWFRSETYSRWQVLIVAPDIGTKVQQAAAAYISSQR